MNIYFLLLFITIINDNKKILNNPKQNLICVNNGVNKNEKNEILNGIVCFVCCFLNKHQL